MTFIFILLPCRPRFLNQTTKGKLKYYSHLQSIVHSSTGKCSIFTSLYTYIYIYPYILSWLHNSQNWLGNGFACTHWTSHISFPVLGRGLLLRLPLAGKSLRVHWLTAPGSHTVLLQAYYIQTFDPNHIRFRFKSRQNMSVSL